jgi:AcrR family transcriptional regulator
MKVKNTRQQILNAAQRLIETGGFLRLTTKEIAREAGFAEGTLFKHFARKEDLCLAVVLENSPKFREILARVTPGERSVAKNLEEIAIAAIQFSTKLIPLGVTLLADASLMERHRQAAQQPGQGPRAVFELLAAYVEGEQRLRRINPQVKPASVAALLFGPCFYWAFVRQGLGKSLFAIKDLAFAAGLVATLVQGLAPVSKRSARHRKQAPRRLSHALPPGMRR